MCDTRYSSRLDQSRCVCEAFKELRSLLVSCCLSFVYLQFPFYCKHQRSTHIAGAAMGCRDETESRNALKSIFSLFVRFSIIETILKNQFLLESTVSRVMRARAPAQNKNSSAFMECSTIKDLLACIWRSRKSRLRRRTPSTFRWCARHAMSFRERFLVSPKRMRAYPALVFHWNRIRAAKSKNSHTTKGNSRCGPGYTHTEKMHQSVVKQKRHSPIPVRFEKSKVPTQQIPKCACVLFAVHQTEITVKMA